MTSDADEVAEEYRSSLRDLVNNSKPHITMLTMLAEENIAQASVIVKVVEEHIQEVNIPPFSSIFMNISFISASWAGKRRLELRKCVGVKLYNHPPSFYLPFPSTSPYFSTFPPHPSTFPPSLPSSAPSTNARMKEEATGKEEIKVT